MERKYTKFMRLTVLGTILSVISCIVLRKDVSYITSLDISTVDNPSNVLTMYYICLALLGACVLFTMCMAITYIIVRHKEIKKYGKRRNGSV